MPPEGGPDGPAVRQVAGFPARPAGCPLCGRMEGARLWRRHGFEWLRCADDGMVWVTPRLEPEAIGQVYARLDARKGKVLSLGQARPPARYFEILDAITKATDGPGRILEVGAFDGGFLRAAREAGWEVAGSEINPAAVQRAREEGIEMQLGELADAAWPDGHFDAIALRDVLEHLPEPRRDLAEMHRLLRPGGTLYIWVPNLWGLTGRTLGQHWGAVVFPWHFNYFGADSLQRMLEASGFELKSLASRNLLWRLVDPWRVLEGRRQPPGPFARRANRLAGRLLAPLFHHLDARGLYLGAQLEAYAQRMPSTERP